MKWGTALVITAILLLIVLSQRASLRKSVKRIRFAYVFLMALAWMLSMLLVYNPNLPGPSQMIDALFSPLGNWLK